MCAVVDQTHQKLRTDEILILTNAKSMYLDTSFMLTFTMVSASGVFYVSRHLLCKENRGARMEITTHQVVDVGHLAQQLDAELLSKISGIERFLT